MQAKQATSTRLRPQVKETKPLPQTKPILQKAVFVPPKADHSRSLRLLSQEDLILKSQLSNYSEIPQVTNSAPSQLVFEQEETPMKGPSPLS